MARTCAPALHAAARDERVLDSYTHDEVAARIAQQMEEGEVLMLVLLLEN
jgi:hypothetical protein